MQSEVNVRGEKMFLQEGQYFEGTLAIVLVDEMGTPYTNLSVNLDESDMNRLDSDEFWYKTHDGHPEIIAEIERAGAVALIDKEAKSGYATYRAAKVIRG